MEADQLAQAIEEQDRKLIADAAQSRLEALGVTENTPALAEAIAAYASGETPTMAQRFAVSHSQEAQRVISEMDAENMRSEISATLSGEEATPYQRSNEWAKNIGTARVNADVYNGDVAESFRDLLRTSQARGSAQKSGAVQAEGQTQELQGLVWHDGELRVKTKDSSGQIQYSAPSAVQIADQGTADFIQELTSRPDQYKNAPAMYAAYQPGQDIGAFINAWNMAENVYGYMEQLQNIWDKALTEAARNAADVGSDTKTAADNDGRVKYSYGGERAETADFKALDEAKQMERENVDAETIRQSTGWFRGMDGKWRFEIDDSKAKYYRGGDAQFRKDHPEYARYVELTEKMLGGSITNEEFAELRELAPTWGAEQRRLQEMVNRGKATLGMILDHEALFEAYPELKNARIRFADLDPGTKGQYNRKYNNFSISNELRNAPEYTLIHEIQHAIQAEEGFSGGASPAYWDERLKNGYPLKKTAAIKEADRKYQELYDSAPEEMKRLLQARSDAMKEMDTDRWDQLEDELYDKYGELFMQIDDADRRRSTVRFDERKSQSKKLYLDTAGEIEAVDASYRLHMRAEERKNTQPDLGDEDTVFADGKELSLQALGLTNTNTPFVEITDDILAGVPRTDWRKTVKDNLKLKYPHGIMLGRNNVVIDNQSRKEMTYSRYTRWLAANNPQIFADKMRATNNSDEILQAARDWINEGPLHPRTDKITDFARGKVLLRIGMNDYVADVVVATEKDGTMKLYDMIDLTPTHFVAKETNTAIARNPSPGGRRNTVWVQRG